MDINEKVATAKNLIAQRDEIDAQLAVLFGGTETVSPTTLRLVDTFKENIQRTITCKNCGQSGHNTRSCKAPPRQEQFDTERKEVN